MMVAFEYDNGAVGSLYYSREVPSLLRGLRMSKLFGRKGVISFESNGTIMVVRGGGIPRLVFPGFRDIRGYKAMYRDFHRAITTGAAPEMSLERAMDDQRLMEQIYASTGAGWADGRRRRATPRPTDSMRTEHFDIVIIGSGAGGGTMAHALARDWRPTSGRRARRGDPARARELESGGRLEGLAVPDAGALAGRARP